MTQSVPEPTVTHTVPASQAETRRTAAAGGLGLGTLSVVPAARETLDVYKSSQSVLGKVGGTGGTAAMNALMVTDTVTHGYKYSKEFLESNYRSAAQTAGKFGGKALAYGASAGIGAFAAGFVGAFVAAPVVIGAVGLAVTLGSAYYLADKVGKTVEEDAGRLYDAVNGKQPDKA